jgi:hypothetical protein
MIRRRQIGKIPIGMRANRALHRKTNRAETFSNGKSTAVGALLVFVSQTVVITGLLYYFGWVRAQADFGYFGIDTSLLGYTTADYVLRSVDSSFPLLTGLALFTFSLLGLHRWVLAHAVSAPVNTPAGTALSVFVSTAPFIGAALAAIVLVRLFFPDEIGWPRGLALPLMLVSAVGLLGYSGNLRSLRHSALGRKREDRPFGSQARIRAVVLVVLGLLGILWWLTLYANQVGQRIAVDSVAGLQNAPEIIIYSSDRIAISGPGIAVDEIRQTGSKYRYRYSGLRLLVQAGGKYVLIPVGWNKGHDSVFLIQIDGTIRLDVID